MRIEGYIEGYILLIVRAKKSTGVRDLVHGAVFLSGVWEIYYLTNLESVLSQRHDVPGEVGHEVYPALSRQLPLLLDRRTLSRLAERY